MEDEPELWQDQQRLYNFLKHYDLLQYHKKFLEKGVRRLSHLKDVAADDASLDEIGLSRPERLRLRKKVKENVEWMGKFKVPTFLANSLYKFRKIELLSQMGVLLYPNLGCIEMVKFSTSVETYNLPRFWHDALGPSS